MAVIPITNLLPEVASHARVHKAGALVDGDFNGIAGPGALATDVTNGVLYINTGTKAATVWAVVGDQTAGA